MHYDFLSNIYSTCAPSIIHGKTLLEPALPINVKENVKCQMPGLNSALNLKNMKCCGSASVLK